MKWDRVREYHEDRNIGVFTNTYAAEKILAWTDETRKMILSNKDFTELDNKVKASVEEAKKKRKHDEL